MTGCAGEDGADRAGTDGTGGVGLGAASGGAPALGGSGTGGSAYTGGTTAGAQSTGGADGATGGAASGGVGPTGGTNATGGVAPTGGTNATGGVAPTGGTNATGGVTPTGGTNATGGVAPSGGTNTTGGVAPTGGTNATGGTGGGTTQVLCSETCQYSDDGECDDGGPGSQFSGCALGTDCADCGTRELTVDPLRPAACGGGASGRTPGTRAEDFALTDQFGNTVHLSDYCGQVVYITLGAMWCPGCRARAEEIPTVVAQYGAQGLIAIDLLAEAADGDTPTTADLLTWANEYGITTPVLADPNWEIWDRYLPDRTTPQSILIGRDGTILEVGWWSLETSIEDAL